MPDTPRPIESVPTVHRPVHRPGPLPGPARSQRGAPAMVAEPALGGRLSDQVYDLVRAAIAAGELEPGARLVELELARRYGVSQAPVRDALRRLAADGLVLQFPRRGSYVADISEEDARQAYRV